MRLDLEVFYFHVLTATALLRLYISFSCLSCRGAIDFTTQLAPYTKFNLLIDFHFVDLWLQNVLMG